MDRLGCRFLWCGSVFFLFVVGSNSVHAALAPTLAGSWPGHRRGPTYSVSIRGNYAYVAAQSGGLVVLDIVDPANPQRVGGLATADRVIDVELLSEQLLLLAGDGGLDIVDISNPQVPSRVRSLPSIGPAAEISMFGPHAF